MMAKDRYSKLSTAGREAMDQGFNPRSMSDEDYAEYVKVHKGKDPVSSPIEGEDADSDDAGDADPGDGGDD